MEGSLAMVTALIYCQVERIDKGWIDYRVDSAAETIIRIRLFCCGRI